MTGKERKIWFWRKEIEARFCAWESLIKCGDKEGAKQAKRQYISAKQTLYELENNQKEVL